MSEIFIAGEAMTLFAADTPGKLEDAVHFTRYVCGAELNVSIGLSRLKHNVTYLTHVGDDPFGKCIYNFLGKENINTSYFKFDKNYPTGFQMKQKVLNGDPYVYNLRKGSAASHITEQDINNVNWKAIRHIHLTGIFPALSDSTKNAAYAIIKKAKEYGIKITFDPNLRPMLWSSKQEMINTINNIASMCDIILPGTGEGLTLTGSSEPKDIADFYISRGAKCVIVKMGKSGAYIKTKEKECTVLGFEVKNVVDTVGAGDGFAVGVISGLLEGLQIEDAVLRGNAIGSLQVMTPGDNDGLPDRQQLKSYMSSAKRAE